MISGADYFRQDYKFHTMKIEKTRMSTAMKIYPESVGEKYNDVTANLSDIRGSIFLSVHLSADGSSPAPTPHHRVHRRGNFILARVRSGAGLYLRSHLLGLLL